MLSSYIPFINKRRKHSIIKPKPFVGAGVFDLLKELNAEDTPPAVVAFHRLDRMAAWCLVVAWVAFASVLNVAIWRLNG